jgi:hypothetical protein
MATKATLRGSWDSQMNRWDGEQYRSVASAKRDVRRVLDGAMFFLVRSGAADGGAALYVYQSRAAYHADADGTSPRCVIDLG